MKSIFKIIAVIIFIGLVTSFVRMQTKEKPATVVQDAETAIKIAVANWTPIYGSKLIESEKPYKAELIGDSVWFVHGTLPEGSVGGTAEIKIRKKDGKVLSVIHGQ